MSVLTPHLTMVTSKEWEGCPYSKTPEGLAMLDLLKDLKLCVGLSLVVRYHPDKNANDPKAADIFKEVTFSYNILFDPDKRRQFDTSGFEEKKIQRQFWKHSSPIRLSNGMALDAAVDVAAEFLNKAVKPVMVGGPELRVAKVGNAFVELADASGAKVSKLLLQSSWFLLIFIDYSNTTAWGNSMF
ncbi:hypothetical protein ACLB2K_066038 [Fragaria x ananassa]